MFRLALHCLSGADLAVAASNGLVDTAYQRTPAQKRGTMFLQGSKAEAVSCSWEKSCL